MAASGSTTRSRPWARASSSRAAMRRNPASTSRSNGAATAPMLTTLTLALPPSSVGATRFWVRGVSLDEIRVPRTVWRLGPITTAPPRRRRCRCRRPGRARRRGRRPPLSARRRASAGGPRRRRPAGRSGATVAGAAVAAPGGGPARTSAKPGKQVSQSASPASAGRGTAATSSSAPQPLASASMAERADQPGHRHVLGGVGPGALQRAPTIRRRSSDVRTVVLSHWRPRVAGPPAAGEVGDDAHRVAGPPTAAAARARRCGPAS